ncbi:fungal-specific transcription factor domain-containing protein [Aspergillus pseudodeflectus]|uniref:Fungal-specific transcription factor domain-containing protein n=1 Tax=Aspergillus pseudodeflectus TaxID=176178 RepID=A0ABR4JA01_9EURO
MIQACYTCRRRHIQCDRSAVPCAKCQKAGLQCLDKRPVRWVQGVAIRGGMRGRSFENSSVSSSPVGKIDICSTPPNNLQSPTPTQHHAKLPTSLGELSPLLQRHDAIVPVRPALPSVPVAIGDAALAGLNSTARYYLDYYNDRICELFIVYDSQSNPFRNLIPLALSDPVLLDALLGLAARHRANFDHPFSTSTTQDMPAFAEPHHEALRFKHRAIQGLAQALNGQKGYRDATVATVFLLVFLDLLESGCDQWNYHLEGAKSLLALTPIEDPGRTIQRLRQFITKQIHLIEALGATFVRPHLLSQSNSIEQNIGLLEDVVEESFLGCPEYILTSLQFLSIQRDIMAHGDATDQAPISDVMSVLNGVKEFDCYFWASTLPQHSAMHNVDDLAKLARTYQLGAVLYGQRVLDALQNTRTQQDSVVSELVSLVDTFKDGSTLLKCILWPITVAGLECQEQSQRDLLIRILETFWIGTHCLNVMNAAKILKAHWAKIDENKSVATNWIFEIGRSSHDWLLI